MADQTQLWAETYERELSGILTAPERGGAAGSPRPWRSSYCPAEQARLTSARTVNPEAYDAYLKGTYHWQKLTAADADTAQRYFELALEKDPTTRRPTRVSRGSGEPASRWEWCRPVRQGPRPRRRHFRLSPWTKTPRGPRGAGRSPGLGVDWDWASGRGRSGARALELNPNCANAHAYYAHFLALTGTSTRRCSTASGPRAGPVQRAVPGLYAMVLEYLRRYDDAWPLPIRRIPLVPMRVSRSASFNAFFSPRGCTTNSWPNRG